jgi:hypothetical protein
MTSSSTSRFSKVRDNTFPVTCKGAEESIEHHVIPSGGEKCYHEAADKETVKESYEVLQRSKGYFKVECTFHSEVAAAVWWNSAQKLGMPLTIWRDHNSQLLQCDYAEITALSKAMVDTIAVQEFLKIPALQITTISHEHSTPPAKQAHEPLKS